MKKSELATIIAISSGSYGFVPEAEYTQLPSHGKYHKVPHCHNTQVRQAQRAAKKRRNVRARSAK